MKPIISNAFCPENNQGSTWRGHSCLPRRDLSRRFLLLVLAASSAVTAQIPPTAQVSQTKFARGQDVVPVYEGWLRNPDGTFSFVFGYFNRNWEEELAIPAGPDNKIEPGPPDRGQPTWFLPRRQAWIFKVQVPADWGSKELVWTITAHGRAEKAFATLMPEEEITERLIMTHGGLSPGDDDPNKPPSITIGPVHEAGLTNPVTLTALVSDDGLPKPRPPRVNASGSIPPAQTNSAAPERPKGLSVNWLEYRGPGKVTFEPGGPILVKNGQAITNARFTEPGTYILRAVANDGALATAADVTITIR
jgi:hypothetical protein